MVFLVALPLCLKIALASGAPLYSGVISGVGGLLVALLSGSTVSVSGPAAGLAVIVATAILVAWDSAWVKKRKGLAMIPGALIVVVVGIGMNELFRVLLDGFYLRAEDGHLVSLPPGGPRDFLAQITQPDWSRLTDTRIYGIALTIAIVGSIESLLTLEASDKIDPQRRISDPTRELLAQGVGSIAAGWLGGLPVTAVIVRSSANVSASAQSCWSSFIHGALLLGCVLLIPLALNRIPLASLAAVLLVIGFRLTTPALYRETWRAGMDQFLPFNSHGARDHIRGLADGRAHWVGVWCHFRDPSKSSHSIHAGTPR